LPGSEHAIDKANLATVEKMWRREVEQRRRIVTWRPERDPKRKNISSAGRSGRQHAARWASALPPHRPHPDRKAVERGLSWFQRISIQTSCSIASSRRKPAEAEYDS